MSLETLIYRDNYHNNCREFMTWNLNVVGPENHNNERDDWTTVRLYQIKKKNHFKKFCMK